MFGKIPSIYENEMMGITKKAQEQSKDRQQIFNLMTQMADSAFNVANEKSQKEVENLKGKTINYVVDGEFNLIVSSDIKIEDVNLPVLNRSDDGMVSIKVSFDGSTNEPRLQYILEGDEGEIAYGTFDMPTGANNGENQHIEMIIKAPNVPAVYQEKCKTIHFVTASKLNNELFNIQPKQIQWKKEYNEQNFK